MPVVRSRTVSTASTMRSAAWAGQSDESGLTRAFASEVVARAVGRRAADDAAVESGSPPAGLVMPGIVAVLRACGRRGPRRSWGRTRRDGGCHACRAGEVVDEDDRPARCRASPERAGRRVPTGGRSVGELRQAQVADAGSGEASAPWWSWSTAAPSRGRAAGCRSRGRPSVVERGHRATNRTASSASGVATAPRSRSGRSRRFSAYCGVRHRRGHRRRRRAHGGAGRR